MPSSWRTGATWRIAGWWARANMNPKPSSSIERAIRSGDCSSAMPSSSSTSADPAAELAARLPCFATAAPAAAATSAAAVEMLNVCAPSPPVPTMSTTGERCGVTGTTCSRIASAKPAISSAVSPFVRRATRKPAIWAGVASPSMIEPISSCASSRERWCPSSSSWIAGPTITGGSSSPSRARAGSARSPGGTARPRSAARWWRTPITSPSGVCEVTASSAGTVSAASEW